MNPARKGRPPGGAGGEDTAGELRRVRHERELLDALNRVLRESLYCETEDEVAGVCLDVAERLTGSAFGLVGRLNAHRRLDTMALSNPGWDACQIPRSTALVSLKDMEVRGIWGSVVRDERSRIVNDPGRHPDRVGLPEGHPPLTSFLGVPLKQGELVFGIIALANKAGGYTDEDLDDVETLSVAFAEVLGRRQSERRLAQQARDLLDASMPILEVLEGIVVVPLIGSLDSGRTESFTQRLLESVAANGAEVAIIDITGVPHMDTVIAQHLLETTAAVKLLGAQVILTGIRPRIALTLVQLGIDLSGLITRSSLMEGLRVALRINGVHLVRSDPTSAP